MLILKIVQLAKVFNGFVLFSRVSSRKPTPSCSESGNNIIFLFKNHLDNFGKFFCPCSKKIWQVGKVIEYLRRTIRLCYIVNGNQYAFGFLSTLLEQKVAGTNCRAKYCATSRFFVPATFCFLILRDIKFPRLLVLKFCATISSTRLFVPRLFVPATFCSCDFFISNAKKTARLFKSRKNSQNHA